jgi:hypothetical protein
MDHVNQIEFRAASYATFQQKVNTGSWIDLAKQNVPIELVAGTQPTRTTLSGFSLIAAARIRVGPTIFARSSSQKKSLVYRILSEVILFETLKLCASRQNPSI